MLRALRWLGDALFDTTCGVPDAVYRSAITRPPDAGRAPTCLLHHERRELARVGPPARHG